MCLNCQSNNISALTGISAVIKPFLCGVITRSACATPRKDFIKTCHFMSLTFLPQFFNSHHTPYHAHSRPRPTSYHVPPHTTSHFRPRTLQATPHLDLRQKYYIAVEEPNDSVIIRQTKHLTY